MSDVSLAFDRSKVSVQQCTITHSFCPPRPVYSVCVNPVCCDCCTVIFKSRVELRVLMVANPTAHVRKTELPIHVDDRTKIADSRSKLLCAQICDTACKMSSNVCRRSRVLHRFNHTAVARYRLIDIRSHLDVGATEKCLEMIWPLTQAFIQCSKSCSIRNTVAISDAAGHSNIAYYSHPSKWQRHPIMLPRTIRPPTAAQAVNPPIRNPTPIAPYDSWRPHCCGARAMPRAMPRAML